MGCKTISNPAQCRFYQFHEKHGDDLAGRRHHYHVPVHVDGRDFDQRHPRRKILQAAIILPNIISAVALATMWIQYVFNYDYGLLNQIVKAFGGENVRWLGTDLIFWAMMIAFIFGSCWLLYADFYQRHRRYPAGFVRSCHYRRREYL